MNEEIAQRLCEQVNWERPELAGLRLAKAYKAGDVTEAACGFVRYLRHRKRPNLGYSREYVVELRENASETLVAEARTRIASILDMEKGAVQGAFYRMPLLNVPPHFLQIGGTRNSFLKMAKLIAGTKETCRDAGWHSWGTTAALCHFLQVVWPLAECPDEVIAAFLCWAIEKHWAEWAFTRNWNESNFGILGHNIWLCNFRGFYKMGLFFPEFKGTEQFRVFVPTYLEREMELLMAQDGFTRERTTGYHCGTADMFFDLANIAKLNGVVLSPTFLEHLKSVAEVTWKLITPDGRFPCFGDGGRTRVLNRLRPLAARFFIPAAKYVAEHLNPNREPSLRKMIIDVGMHGSSGENFSPGYERLEARPPETVDTCLPESRICIMRQNWLPSADYLAIDAGPVGYVASSHGHSAIFDIQLYSRGRPILIDDGPGPYGDSPERKWRQGTLAHNVATVDGREHIERKSEWRFERVILPVVEKWLTGERFAYFSGVHEAYLYLSEPVVACRRKIFYLRGGYWILIDRFTAQSEEDKHEYQIHFHMSVPVEACGQGRVVTKGVEGNLLILPVPDADGALKVEACPYPIEEGKYENPDHVSYTRRVRGHGLLVTLLVPFEGDRPPEVKAQLAEVEADGRELTPWEVTALFITIDGRSDFYFDQHMHWNLPWSYRDWTGKGRLFHSQCGEIIT